MNCFQAPFALWKLDKSFKVISTNPAAIHLGETPFAGLQKEDEARLKVMAQTRDEKGLSMKWELKGKSKWLHWHTWKEDDTIYFSADDVTDLKNNELYLHQIVDAIPDMILVKGEASRILWANKAFKDYYGMNIEELQEIIDAPFQNSDHTRQYVYDDAWVWNNKKPLRIECEPVTNHEGVTHSFETLKTPICDPNGNIKMTVGISRDITQKIEYEQKSFASSKMASLGEMAGGIAHEINNPIGIIMGKSMQMKRQYGDAKTNSDLDMIIRSAERVAKIVEGLRNFCQQDDRQLFTDFKVIEVLDETLTYCHGRLDNLGIKIMMDVPENLIMSGKRVQISQILLNLLNNAIDEIQRINERWIKISATKNGNFTEIRVQDSGLGVSPELESKIMQPFFTTKELGKGMGLGLSVSFAIAKHHGGELLLDRKVSPSCFLLRIPSAS